jgi:hypothetical protein
MQMGVAASTMCVGVSMKVRSAPERARQSEAAQGDNHEGDAEF